MVFKVQTVLILSSVCKMTWELWHDLWDSFVSFLYHQVYLWKIQNLALASFFLGLSNGPKPWLTIVSDFGENHWKTIDVNGQSVKNIQWWWFSGNKTIEKPLIAMVPSKKFITIPSFWKNYHRWSLYHRQGDAGGVTSNCNQAFQTPGRQPDRWEQERRTQLSQVLSAD